jgi:hypothetical protein
VLDKERQIILINIKPMKRGVKIELSYFYFYFRNWHP